MSSLALFRINIYLANLHFYILQLLLSDGGYYINAWNDICAPTPAAPNRSLQPQLEQSLAAREPQQQKDQHDCKANDSKVCPWLVLEWQVDVHAVHTVKDVW